jgi:hypothetical protein
MRLAEIPQASPPEPPMPPMPPEEPQPPPKGSVGAERVARDFDDYTPDEIDAHDRRSAKDAPSRIKLTWHGEGADEPLVDWLAEDMLYRAGVGLISGQWGTYKTFIGIDLSASVMTKTPFAGRAIHRQGGVLFIAAEGQSQIPIRLKGVALGKIASITPDEGAVKIDPDKMPFVWSKQSPRLSDPEAFGELRAMIGEAARGMRERFGLPLALVIIDAMMPAAQFKDANDATEARQVMDMLAALGREFDVLVIPIDHFGKDVSTGTRNSSGKEDAAETILALLGERSIEGKLSNPRMALRKVKGGEQGVVFPFEPREVIVGETGGGKPIRTFVIEWQAPADQDSAFGTPKPWPKSLLIFKRALDKTLGERGKRLRPFPDGPEVLAVAAAAVRAEFVKAYPVENEEPKAKAKAKAKAFERAIKQAIDANLVCARDLEPENFDTFYWRLDVK